MRRKRRSSGRSGSSRTLARCTTATAALVAAALLAGPAPADVRPARAEDVPSPERPAALALVADVVERYESAATYRLSFVQESYWALADTIKATRGTLLVDRSGRIALTYDDGGRAVADSETLRVFVPQTMQFFVATVDPSDIAVDPARVLKAYTPDRDEPFVTAARTGAAVTINMIPRERYGEPARLEVTVDSTRREVTGLVAHSSTGDSTTYRIVRTVFDADISENDFRLRRPVGTEIIRGSPFGAGFGGADGGAER